MTEDDFYTRIVEAPEDDSPRLVYADWLLERGDPRGEFIVLQCKKEPTKDEIARIGVLRTAFAATWMGDLARIASKKYVARFERGFLSHLYIRSKPEPIKNQTTTISLVHTLNVSIEQLPADSPFLPWLFRQTMPSLRRLRGVNAAVLLELMASEKKRPIETIGLYSSRVQANDQILATALTNNRGLPMLRHLVMHDTEWTPLENLRWVFNARPANAVSVQVNSPYIANYIRALNENYRGVPSVSAVVLAGLNEDHDLGNQPSYAISKDKKGSWTTLRVSNPTSVEALTQILTQLPEWSVRRLIIDSIPKEPNAVAAIRSAVAHLPRLQLEMS